MSEGDQPTYCGQCGNPVQEGDSFCDMCGARIAPVAPADPQAIPQPVAAAQGAAHHGRRRTRSIFNLVAISLILLLGIGTLAALALNGGLGFLGEAAPTSSSTSSNDAPDPTFDLLLPTLKERTTAPIMLPAELPNDFKNVAVDEDLSGDRYGVVFLLTPPDEVVQNWYRAQAVGTLTATPEAEREENKYFEAASTEGVELPDGSEATLSRMEPVSEGGTQGPYWEGKFARDGYTYALTVISEAPAKGDVEQALSSMVLVRGLEGATTTGERAQPTTPSTIPPEPTTSPTPEPTASDSYGQSTEEIEAEAEEAAGDYYRAAGVEDWDYTYEHLDSGTRSLFTRDEWFQKNRWFADNGQVIYHIESVRRLGTSSGLVVEVKMRLTYEDGSSSTRATYFVYEDGEWKHAFGQEESDLFMPDASYEEFVEARQGL